MKKRTSVAALALQLTWKWAVLIFLAVGLCQVWIYWNEAAFTDSFEWITDAQHIDDWGKLGFAALVAMMLLCGCEFKHNRFGYTLRRLGVPEWEATFIWALVFAGWLFLYWVFQLGMLLGMHADFFSWVRPEATDLILAGYRGDYFHLVMPLRDGTGYLRNMMMCLGGGGCCAMGAHWIRHGKKGVVPTVCFLIATFLLAPGAYGYAWADGLYSILVAAMLVVFAVSVRKGEDDEEA